MSLSSLNSPPLVTVLSLGCYGLFPILQESFQDKAIPWAVVKGANVLAYGLSLWSVSQPGRYDSEAAAAATSDESGKDSAGVQGMRKMGVGRQGRTLVPPAGWAFAIWAPIFIGELVMVATQSQLAEGAVLEDTIRRITGPYLFAQAFQTLWTASFRPKYSEGFYKYVSALNLAVTALSLSFCQQAFAENRASYSSLEYWMYFLPLTLHFGWTTAASIVNVNGMFAMDETVSSKSVALLGHLSILAATAIGVGITVFRQAPVYGGVVCWALSAVASGLKRRIHETEKEDPNRVGVFGAKTQRMLSRIGAVCCAVATAYVTLA